MASAIATKPTETRFPPTYWADEWEPRDHCFRLTRSLGPAIDSRDWDIVWGTLGNMGYRFRDAGYCSDYMVLSLDRELGPQARRFLTREGGFKIQRDNGNDLGSAR